MPNELTKRLCHSQFQGNELYHHGILGMHWGEKNGPPYPLSSKTSNKVTSNALKLTNDQKMAIKNIKHARTANLDRFGTTADNNVLFIAGYSGSGKSTTALGFKRAGDHVIHLDLYSEPGAHTDSHRDRTFDKYLKTKVPNWDKIQNASEQPKTGEIKRYGDEYWKAVDAFRDAVESFSKSEFRKGNRVIVEGVQMSDDWLSADKGYYKSKPMIILSTNPILSMRRAFERDGRGNLIKGLTNMDDVKDYVMWYAHTNARLNDLAKTSSAKKGQEYLKDIIVNIGNTTV